MWKFLFISINWKQFVYASSSMRHFSPSELSWNQKLLWSKQRKSSLHQMKTMCLQQILNPFKCFFFTQRCKTQILQTPQYETLQTLSFHKPELSFHHAFLAEIWTVAQIKKRKEKAVWFESSSTKWLRFSTFLSVREWRELTWQVKGTLRLLSVRFHWMYSRAFVCEDADGI